MACDVLKWDMPVFLLDKDPVFPSAKLASREGIIAIGGELTPQWLVNAYSSGIFPWFNEGDPPIWWSPTPRMVLFPEEVHESHSMRKCIKKNIFRWTMDRDFPAVISHCGNIPRKGQPGTWITPDMKAAYIRLYLLGYAHSLEVWNSRSQKLVGGIYGVSLGNCFFGESMFSLETNASKFAFITLARKLRQLGFAFMDCQMYTHHLKSLGARAISRRQYLKILEKALCYKTLLGRWYFMESPETPALLERRNHITAIKTI